MNARTRIFLTRSSLRVGPKCWGVALIASAGLTGPGQALAQGPAQAPAQDGRSLYTLGASALSSVPAKPKAAPAAPAAVKAVVRPKAGARARARPAARTPAAPLALNGRWHDRQCIPLTGVTHSPPLFVKRQYEFNDARKAWRLDATVFPSDSCVIDTRMLTYHGQGSFAIVGKSAVAGNAYEASFRIDRWSATPDTREGVLTLLNGRCGSGNFEPGRPLDLSASGCPTLGIRSLAQAPREMELVGINDGKFFLGTRSFLPGLGDNRPAQLSSYALVPGP